MITADPDKVHIVYVDEDGTAYHQPVSDVVREGTLISPITDEDMEVHHVAIEAIAPADPYNREAHTAGGAS